MYNLLISTDELSMHLNDPDWLVADCRTLLADPERKKQEYLSAHIPGAVYVQVENNLSSQVIPGVTGRHPLPGPEKAAERMGQLGIGEKTQVVAYDDQGGALAAARLWMILRWLGHEKAAVLDGGFQKWMSEKRPVRDGLEIRPSQIFVAKSPRDIFATTTDIERIYNDPSYCLVDVRLAERYTGENETIDPIPGHIPGAINIPYPINLNESGTFRSPDALKKIYLDRLGKIPTNRIVFYCGSGLTAIHSYLALLQAGLGESKVYAGSWSEWITDRNRPVATGPGRI